MTLDWTCIFDECTEQIRKRDYCVKHYDQLKRAGKLGGNLCKVDGCKHGLVGRGYCSKHYSKAKAAGEFNLEKCSVSSCGKQRHGNLYCQMHYNMNKNYGIDPEVYEQMVVEQDSKCAICDVKQDKLVIDHDHGTEEVRALLCISCNRGIGFLKDNPYVLESAAKYLHKFKPNSQPLL